jgi:hypothetical protein
MNNLREQLKVMLGDSCPQQPSLTYGVVQIALSQSALDQLMEHWNRLSPEGKPRLCGVTLTRDAKPNIQLLLSPSSKGPNVLLTIEAGASIPRLREVWPHAEWWEEELCKFENLTVGAKRDTSRRLGGGVAWQQN